MSGSGEDWGTQLRVDTSRSGPQRRVGGVVRRRKGREASAECNQEWLADYRARGLVWAVLAVYASVRRAPSERLPKWPW